MHFDVHARRLDAERRTRMHDGEAHAALPRRATGQRPWVLWRAVGYGMSLIAGSWREAQARQGRRGARAPKSGFGLRRIASPACAQKKTPHEAAFETTRAAESVPPTAPGEADAAR
jgi:hypothetical protein